MEKTWTVYMHTNKINNKVYVGITSQKVQNRWNNGKGYFVKNKEGRFSQQKFARAIQKYGWDNFEHIILFSNLSLEEVNNLEQKYIALYNSTDENFGYNIQTGGKNYNHSEETKRKIGKANSIALKGNAWSDQ